VQTIIECKADRMKKTGSAAGKRGQAMIEYVIIAVLLIATVSILAVFLYTFKQNSGRTLDLIAYEYP